MIHWLPNSAGYILHERAASFHAAGTGWLSIKCFFQGAALYRVGRGYHAINDAAYLVLNHGQSYTLTIDAEQPVESFCLFFAPGFAESVRRSLTTPLDRLLESDPADSGPSLHLFERTYLHDAILSPALFELRRSCASDTLQPALLIEQFHTIVERLLRAQSVVSAEVDAFPAARAATRNELYRRLYLAKDYADALYATPMTLDDMADVAGFSANHLLRTFKQAFGQSPHQYVTSRRLAQAQLLLQKTDQSITEVCHAVGFESLSAFSWLFRRRFGVSPQQYREQSR